jgi:hypothetical protein
MNGLSMPQDKPASEPGFFSTPVGKIGLNVVLFAAGVILLQSPVMDMLVPQFD